MAVATETNINRYCHGETPLFHAVATGSRNIIIEALCSMDGIDINKGNESGETPLSKAVMLKNGDFIKLLCQNYNVNVDHKDWETAESQNDMLQSQIFYPLLVCMAVSGYNKFDISKRNRYGDNLSHMAVKANLLSAFDYLSDQIDVDFNVKNQDGKRAFDLLFPDGGELDDRNLMSLLQIAHRTEGKDVFSRKDSRGRTVLHLAVLEGDENIFMKLCHNNEVSIDINTTDNMGKTALHLAIEKNMDNVTLFLLSQPEINVDIYEQPGGGIFYVLEDIIKRQRYEDDICLKKIFTALPTDKENNLPNILEELFKTADRETSILSDLGSKIGESTCPKELKSIYSALQNIIITGLQRHANHKRLRYIFFKGSVFRTLVQIFVDLDGDRYHDSYEYLAQLLKILYISMQANIRCNCVEDTIAYRKHDNTERSNNINLTDIAEESNNINITDHTEGFNEQNLSDNTDESDKVLNVIKFDTASSSKTHKEPDVARKALRQSLKITLEEKLYSEFRDKIKTMFERDQENCGEIGEVELIAKSINKTYFKDKEGCCGTIKKTAAEASDWLSSMLCLNEIFHKCICRGDFAFVFCFISIFIQTSDIVSDISVGYKTFNGFSERLGILMMGLAFVSLIHENIRSLASAYSTDKEELCISLGKFDPSPDELAENSELNYYNDLNPLFKWIARFFWTFKVCLKSKNLTKESIRPLFLNALSILMLRPIVDRLIVLTHSPSNLRTIYRQQSKQKSLNQYYMILEQMPELLIQFYVFQIYFNNLRTAEDHKNHGCTAEFRSFTYRTEYFECVESLWALKICASWWEIYSMLVPFLKIPMSMVSLEEMFRKLSPETPKMTPAALWLLYTAYILMIPSRLFLFAAVMHSTTRNFHVVAYFGFETCIWLVINMSTVIKQKLKPTRSSESKEEKRKVFYFVKAAWSLLLFTIRDEVVISLRCPDAYILSPSEVDYKTLRNWKIVLGISASFFVEGVAGAVIVEHNYPCGRSTEIFKYQGWLYLITLIISITIITLLSYILQPTKMNIVPQQFSTKAALICSLGFVKLTVGFITFLLTTKEHTSDIRLPLIITALIVLSVFLAVVVILRKFSEAKPKKSIVKKGDHATNGSKIDKSCCIPNLPCFHGESLEDVESAPARNTSQDKTLCSVMITSCLCCCSGEGIKAEGLTRYKRVGQDGDLNV